jgi:hypothetical protein
VRVDGQATAFTGGLYPDGSNERPPEHDAAGQELASSIVPLGADGREDPVSGRIGLVSLGMSNTEAEFQAFMDLTHRDAEVNPQVVLVNGALGGQTADRWLDPAGRPYAEIDRRLEGRGLTPSQVQVFWIKQVLPGRGEFPAKATDLENDLKVIVRNLAERFPNLKLVFLSSRTRSYLYGRGLSPEPAAFESGFAVKWLIEAQIRGDPELNYDPDRGPVVAPYLAWGPYLWINGEEPRSDGMVWTAQDLAADCTHPSQQGAAKVAQMLREFFLGDGLTAGWFGAAGASSRALATAPVPPASPPPTRLATGLPSATPAPAATPTPAESVMRSSRSSTPFQTGGMIAAVVIAGVIGTVALRRRKVRRGRAVADSAGQASKGAETDGGTKRGDVGRALTWAGETLRQAGWAPLLVFVVYIGAAVILDLFSAFPRLDLPMHFAGGLATAYFVSHGLQNARRIWGRPSAASAWDTVVVLALTLLVALLWEGVEFSSDRLFGTQEQLGTADTVRDLLAGMLGALAYVAIPKVFPRPEG